MMKYLDNMADEVAKDVEYPEHMHSYILIQREYKQWLFL